MFVKLGFALTAVATLSMALGCSRSWPTVTAVSDPKFASHAEIVRSVDVLPVDMQVWTYPGSPYSVEALARGLDSMLLTMVHEALVSRSYTVAATIDWDGTHQSGVHKQQVMLPEDLAITTLSLSTYGQAQSRSKGPELLTPHIPVPLGRNTGSDATLYVGGWAYAGDDRQPSKGAKVAKGVLIGVLVVGVIALVIAGSKGGGSSVGKAAGGLAKGAATVAKGVGKGLSNGFGRVAGRLISTAARGVIRTGIVIGRHGPRIAVESLDAFGRAGFDTHIHVAPQRPDYSAHPRTPRKGRSSMLLEMTLIDNHSGRVLWHARKRFPAAPYRADHIKKAVGRMMRSLPQNALR